MKSLEASSSLRLKHSYWRADGGISQSALADDPQAQDIDAHILQPHALLGGSEGCALASDAP
jgi:hypothetical protein